MRTPVGAPGPRRIRGMAWLFIGAYVLTTLWFTCGSMIGNAEPGLVAYLFTWDMFPYHYTESVRRVAVGRSTSGRIVRLVPSKLEQYRGGVHDDLTRADLDPCRADGPTSDVKREPRSRGPCRPILELEGRAVQRGAAFAFEGGLRYNENVIAVGAQFERRGDAWPVRGLLGGKDLAGRFLSGVSRQAAAVRRMNSGP